MSEMHLVFNGINGATGDYDLPPMTGEELASVIQHLGASENAKELRFHHLTATEQTHGLKEGLDPKKLDEAGWGIVFAHDADPAIEEALADLLALRRTQAGSRFRLFKGAEGYRRGLDTKSKFLGRFRASPGPVDPDRVPYYLLIVGHPEEIPYRFQYELDVQYAVGRLDFDTVQDYANYAASVVAAEKRDIVLPRAATFFGVANPGDRATKLSADNLIEPLVKAFSKKNSGWDIRSVMQDGATKAHLQALLGGPETPALLMTASHGMGFPLGDPRQLQHQGALLCQDWPGQEAWGRRPISRDHYFAADDVAVNTNLLGLLAFFFACYGAGTPEVDEYSKKAFAQPRPIAPFSFSAELPKKMLSHPRGGALAVVGHIERAWSFSFDWPDGGAQTAVFESTLQRLFDGHPIGSALEYFNQRWAELSTMLTDELAEIEADLRVDPYELARMWMANNDARGYAIMGDPAVRLSVGPVVEEHI